MLTGIKWEDRGLSGPGRNYRALVQLREMHHPDQWPNTIRITSGGFVYQAPTAFPVPALLLLMLGVLTVLRSRVPCEVAAKKMDLNMNNIKLLQGISLDEEAEEIESEEVDDEDEEEEAEEYVTLGIVEKPKNPKLLLRHLFPSKSGGVPAWLDPVDLLSGKSCRCGFCEQPLQFLLQIYAPMTENEATFHRMLYVFMCPSMSCLIQDQHEQWKCREDNPRRSVKVFRCQLPRLNPFYSSDPPRHDGTDKPSSAGVSLCSWCGTWKGEKVCSSCKRARYCTEKHQAMHWKSGHKNQCRQIIYYSESSSSDSSVKLPNIDKVACSTLWPEYEIIIEDECAFDMEASEDNSCATSLVPKHTKTDDTYQHLLGEFEADENKRSWASFQERISKCPNQVLRYCRDLMAKPLWPLSIGRPSVANIPKCNYCNGPLCYEFQIMPQLLYYFGVKNDPDSLDWGTIVVYTCLASCQSSISYKEEFAWVLLYPTAPMT
ncbi:programmed cell death protein 2 [Canna indica]|uniref:Programmed cell death protein 2 n=1 Tax=Canna indica TaxID=4628 RepID=A0AAQ3JKS0_9LILI|nr:programmed cell death protein 2 [Canna indica]